MSTGRIFSRVLLFSLLMLPVAATALAAETGSADEKAVVARFQALLDGLGQRDKAAMAAQLLPGACYS